MKFQDEALSALMQVAGPVSRLPGAYREQLGSAGASWDLAMDPSRAWYDRAADGVIAGLMYGSAPVNAAWQAIYEEPVSANLQGSGMSEGAADTTALLSSFMLPLGAAKGTQLLNRGRPVQEQFVAPFLSDYLVSRAGGGVPENYVASIAADARPTAIDARLLNQEGVPLGLRPENRRQAGAVGDLGGVADLEGKPVASWSPEDFKRYGDHYGVENLGPLSKIEDVEGLDGSTLALPGGVDGEFTYLDLLSLKANPIDPSTLPMDLRIALQQKLSRSVSPKPGDRVETFNRYMFGMLSPNQPLTPNEFEYMRTRVRSEKDIDRLAAYIDWEPGDTVSAARRKSVEEKIKRSNVM